MRRLIGLRWFTIGLIMLGAMVNFLSRQSLSIAAPTVMASLHITAREARGGAIIFLSPAVPL